MLFYAMFSLYFSGMGLAIVVSGSIIFLKNYFEENFWEICECGKFVHSLCAKIYAFVTSIFSQWLAILTLMKNIAIAIKQINL